MRFFILLLLILVITPVAEYFFPWWMIALVPFSFALAMNIRGGVSFLAGFLGIAIFWYVVALRNDIPNKHLLSHRMSVLFKLHDYGLFLIVTASIGGLIGGLSAWSGSLLRVRKHPNQVIYGK